MKKENPIAGAQRCPADMQPKVEPPPDLSESQTEDWVTAEHFRLLIEGAKDYAILLLDGNGRILTWNSGASEIFGYQAKKVIGNHFSFLYSEIDQPLEKARQALEHAKAHGSLDERRWFLRQDGSRIYAELFVAPIYDGAGELTNFSMIIRDVTERVELRKKLREKEHLATIGTTAAMFAHEISNPLNGIGTTIQLLERALGEHEFSEKTAVLSSIEELKSEIRRLRSLLDEFKTLARPTALDLKPVDIGDLVSQLIRILAANFDQAKIECVVDLPPGLPPLSGDADKLKQALLNLVKNAIEAMPNGGKITLKGYERDAQVCLEITDTGMGIPEGLRIFDLYETTKPGGSGVGLVIVQRIITAHGGSIYYKSQSGMGTTFHVNLPSVHSSKSE